MNMKENKSFTLVIMAAGMGSRYGGIKQLEKFGPNQRIILEYSILDAIKYGCNKVVVIIRKDIEQDMRETLSRLESELEIIYAYQELTSFVPEHLDVSTRAKPWGTAHAAMCALPYTDQDFIIINADDYYGAEPFEIVSNYFSKDNGDSVMAGYHLANQLSENGTVSRGICIVDKDNYLQNVVEHKKIEKINGKVISHLETGDIELPEDSYCSMQFWGLRYTPQLLKIWSQDFQEFAKANVGTTEEFLLPTCMNSLIQNSITRVKVIPTKAKWAGITYKEDKAKLEEFFKDKE